MERPRFTAVLPERDLGVVCRPFLRLLLKPRPLLVTKAPRLQDRLRQSSSLPWLQQEDLVNLHVGSDIWHQVTVVSNQEVLELSCTTVPSLLQDLRTAGHFLKPRCCTFINYSELK